MKRMHRDDLYAWSVFDEGRNIDFHGLVWVRAAGNVLIDPLPMSAHDAAHLASLGPVSHVVVTNSDHARDASRLAAGDGVELCGPAGERDGFPLACDRWLDQGDVVVPGLAVHVVHGSKTPGELALVLEGSTLITGDLIRAHEGGRLCMLPDAKLADRARAAESVRRIAGLEGIEAVLPGDGWPVFRHGGEALAELAASL